MDLLKKLKRTQRSIEREKKELGRGYVTLKVPKKKVVKRKKKPKRKVIKKKPVKSVEHDLLKDALMDLNKELRSLRSTKVRLQRQLEQTDKESSSNQNKEIRLRNQISELMKKAAVITKRKSTTKDKLLALNKKIDKVISVSRQLKE